MKYFTFIAVVLMAAMSQLAAKPSAPATKVLTTSNDQLNAELAAIVSIRPPVDDFGVVLANIHDISADLRRTAKQELQFSDRLQIISIQSGSLADQLGLKPGDQLLQINSFYVSRGQSALKQFSDRVEGSVKWNEPINTTIIRDGYGQTHSSRTALGDS